MTRVFRGSSWHYIPLLARVANLSRFTSVRRDNYLGFRIAREES